MMNKAENGETYIARGEAARILCVSNRTVNRWVDKGVLKAWRTVGGQSRIYKSSVEALLRARKEQTEPKKSADPMTILVVDDDPELLEVFCLHLESYQLPIRVVTAINGFEGLVAIGKESPKLVITDLMMPGMDGFQMIRSLNESSGMDGMEFIVITILEAGEIQERGGLPEGVQVFHKPLRFDEIETKVRRIVGERMDAASPSIS